MSERETTLRDQYLVFSLAATDYAVPVLKVKEILQYDTVTHVPSVPSSIRGVINLRGAVVPVLDLAVKLGLSATAITKRTCVIIVEAELEEEHMVMGVMSDAVREVLDLGPEDIAPPPSFGTQVRADHLIGMGKAGKGFVLLLDLDRVVSASDRELAIEHAQLAAAVQGQAKAPSPAEGKAPAPEGIGDAHSA